MSTKFILEYRFEDDEEWVKQVEYSDLLLIQEAYVTHIARYNQAFCRIRAVRVVEESRVLGEYQPLNMEEY